MRDFGGRPFTVHLFISHTHSASFTVSREPSACATGHRAQRRGGIT
jgi:hypothetical protein